MVGSRTTTLQAPRWDDDPAAVDLRADDVGDTHDGDTHEHDDPLGQTILTGNTRWSLDLDDPHAWIATASAYR